LFTALAAATRNLDNHKTESKGDEKDQDTQEL
jgi:hypothetical protein